jgi:hypothetical protein
MSDDRRNFPRLPVQDEAIVYNDRGKQVGRVTMASGGGFQLQADALHVAQELEVGQRMRLTIEEPGPHNRHGVDVFVRYRQASVVGFEFAGNKPKEQS